MEFVIFGMHHRVIHSFFLSLISFFPSFYSLYFSLGVTLVSVSNTQAIHNIGSWVYDHTTSDNTCIIGPIPQDGSARSDLPAGGQEEVGGVSQSESMVADMMKMLVNLTIKNQQLLQQQLKQQQRTATAGGCELQQQTAAAAGDRGLQ